MTARAGSFRRLDFRRPEPLLKGLDAAVSGLRGWYRRHSGALARLRSEAQQTEALAAAVRDLTDHSLREQLAGFSAVFRRGPQRAEPQLLAALAAIREAAARQLGLRPYPVQLMGALALYRGWLAEMATGEGKTLTAGLAAVLVGWSRRPCHIVTVNDYLAQRDAELLAPLYEFCGVRVGCVTGPMPPDARRMGYDADVTYTTSKEVVADFLRDSLQLGMVRDATRRLVRRLLYGARPEQVVMRGLHTGIIDEADSVLIDEAVTPLIISSPRRNEGLCRVVREASRLVEGFIPGRDYRRNDRYREVELTAEGEALAERSCAELHGIWQARSRRIEWLKQALVAREFFLRDKNYIVADGKAVIVDEFTGRPMPQRTWREGLHQAIEAKEGLSLSDPSETLARLSFQRYFRLYHRLAGMTGTAREAATEFWQVYGLAVVTIPTHRPCVRERHADRCFATEKEKWDAVVAEIGHVHSTGRPILVGTRSVAASEGLARRLEAQGLDFKVLNAVRHHEEALVVALAGQPARITIATNMAGRGTDIKLRQGVAQLGGLHVIATERHESERVDRQLFGRCARQGDPGSAQAFVSAQDELLKRYLPTAARAALGRLLKAGGGSSNPVATAAFKAAQSRAQRFAYRQRCAVLRTDTWLDETLAFSGPSAT